MTQSTPSGTSTSKYTIGGSLEYEDNPTEHILEAPLYLEYSPSSRLTFAAQVSLFTISSPTPEGGSESGVGDLETSIDYIFIPERRYRPAIALTSTLRWPTASNPAVGNSGIDGSLGIITSKDVVLCEITASLIYTKAGDPDNSDELEMSLGVDYPVYYTATLLAELVQTTDVDGLSSGGGRTELTLGAEWEVNPDLTLEIGVQADTDDGLRGIISWSYWL